MSTTYSPPAFLEQLGRLSLSRRVLVLLGWFGLFLLGSLSFLWIAAPGSASATVAATGICLFSSLLALLVTGLMIPPHQAAAHALAGMAFRMSPPLLACLIVTQRGGPLADNGFAWALTAAFLWGLALETLFSVGQLQPLAHGSERVPGGREAEPAGRLESGRSSGASRGKEMPLGIETGPAPTSVGRHSRTEQA